METSIIFVGNSGYVEISNLFNPHPDVNAYANAATVTTTISTLSDVLLATLPMPYIASSNGRYVGTIAHDIGVTAGAMYKVRVVALQSGLKFDETTQVIAKVRTNLSSICTECC